ncbi:B-cell receptor CD22-like isoform X2 [Myxocyprinus asiaticus]|uniref:B-cell receptor CD22-like isoform X2 n=1 Tax=Myxocyprinus asiaticus TaxID=70543 RepID=UPI002221938A|nr:B-cell receptor CD22-like isoform X2 [Myxocyprinus asiaticus]
MLYIILLMQLHLSAVMYTWSVSYSPETICAFEGSSVDFSCSFEYPYSHTLGTLKWFKPETYQKQDGSHEGIVVYHSNAKETNKLYQNRTVYTNQDKNCSFKLHNVSKTDIGRYFFRLTTNSRYGKFTGPGGINLNVAVLPFRVTVHREKANGHIHEGDSVTLTCGLENCTPKQGPFAWFKNKLLLPHATESELKFSFVSHEDFGNYSCGLKNSNRTLTNETLLDVRYSPKNVEITVFPSGEIQEGDSLTLICKSNANPAVTNYTWFKISRTNVSYVGCSREYSIRVVSQTDDGQYFCIAENDIGYQNSTVLTVTVLKVEEPGHQHFLLAATGALFFGIAVTLVIFCLVKRRTQFATKRLTEQRPTATLTEEVYENLRKMSKPEFEENLTNLTYAELMLPPTNTDRPRHNSQEDRLVIYSLVRNNEDH